MTNGSFEHTVVVPGESTDMTLAELLEVSDQEAETDQLRAELEQIREAERAAEAEGATVRLY